MGRSIGTIGSRVIGDIFATRSSRSLQSPAEEVVGAALVGGALGDGTLGGATLGGGGQVGARAASGSSVAPLGGRTGFGFEDPGREEPGREEPGREEPGRYVTGPIGTIDEAPGTLGGARLVVGALAVYVLLGHIPFGQFTAGFAVGFVVGEP
jgi:hypothetical protein